jgi:hypothetical protein
MVLVCLVTCNVKGMGMGIIDAVNLSEMAISKDILIADFGIKGDFAFWRPSPLLTTIYFSG